MPATQKYFHDKVVLLLLSVNFFLAFLSSLLILLRLSDGEATNYIVQYRSNLGLSAYKTGGIGGLLEFVLFVVLILGVHLVLSIKTYHIQRQLSVTILSMGILLLVIATIVSNSLLVLR